ncbi:MAG: O-antigen ligase family protein [Gaiellales bacterium]
MTVPAQLPRAVAIARALPPFVVLGVGVAILTRDGGFHTQTWYPAALLCLGLAVVMAYVGIRPPSGLALATTSVLLAYVGWAFATTAWADVQDVAWQGANLTLLYALVFGCTALSRLGAASTAGLTLAFCLGIVGVGTVFVAHAAYGAGDPEGSVLYAGRLSEPTGYPNATAAMFSLGLWAALGLALEPELRREVRAVAFGAAGMLAGLDLLCQSRGAVFTLPLVVAVFFALARRRLIALTTVAVAGFVVAAGGPVLLDVFPAETAEARRNALAHSFIVLLVTGLVLTAAGLLLPLLERAPAPGPRARHRLRLAGGSLAALAVAVGLALGSPVARLSAAWDSFEHGGVPQGSSRFVGLGSNRYDFWRVGLSEFRDHPVTGIGVDNFAAPYLVERRSSEQPLYPHSLWVRVVSQTGVVGAMLLIGFLALALVTALKPRPGLPRSLVGGLVTGFCAWLLHAQVDWLWEMPALGFGAFALLGLAVGACDPEPAPRTLRRELRLGSRVGAGVVVASCALSFGIPWLAGRYEARAITAWPEEPGRAIALARRAAGLDPVRDDSLVLAGAMQSRLGDYPAMRDDFARAVDRNPFNWYAELELAVAYGALGNQAEARRHARRAAALNPRDPLVRRTAAAIERGETVEPASIDRAIAASDPT